MKLTPKKVDKLLALVQEQLKMGKIRPKEFNMSTYENKTCSVDGEGCNTQHCISGWLSVLSGLTTREINDEGDYEDKPYGSDILSHDEVYANERMKTRLELLFLPPETESKQAAKEKEELYGSDFRPNMAWRGKPFTWSKYKRKHAIRAIELFREGDPDPWVTVNQEIRAKEI